MRARLCSCLALADGLAKHLAQTRLAFKFKLYLDHEAGNIKAQGAQLDGILRRRQQRLSPMNPRFALYLIDIRLRVDVVIRESASVAQGVALIGDAREE